MRIYTGTCTSHSVVAFMEVQAPRSDPSVRSRLDGKLTASVVVLVLVVLVLVLGALKILAS